MEGTVLTEPQDARSRLASCPDIQVSPPGTDAAFIMSDSALISSMNISRNVVHDRFARGQRQIDAAQQRESRIEIAR
jgi:hypothetical protein